MIPKELLEQIDEFLAILEDRMHGEDGDKVTKLRKDIQKLLDEGKKVQ